ncbi:O-methyltransferase [Pseudonocardia sp. ICBG1293]|uniref:O-methyltransferase n=1 Tax=Pseudonocardia sp. ICBG1293 TaxID=2844382 RepID=UPI001CCC11B5|nr:O-methyltransferase [Pseudonocardia sp. ICBG1293]
MDPALAGLLGELEEFGASHDASTDDRSRKMLNITHDTGVFLSLLIKATASRHVLEIGTSNGYSTLWLADAVGPQGTVTTIEQAPDKIDLAHRNIDRAGLTSRVHQILGDAGEFLTTTGHHGFDLVFLDSDREQYTGWWPHLQRMLPVGRLLVVDNAVSHAHQMTDFRETIDATTGWLSSLSPIGNGELLVLRER